MECIDQSEASMDCIDQSEAGLTWGGTSTQTGSMRPHLGSDQLTSLATPSLNTSRMPGFSPEDDVMRMMMTLG